MNATASRNPAPVTRLDGARATVSGPSRRTAIAEKANAATVTHNVGPTPKTAMRRPATGAPSR